MGGADRCFWEDVDDDAEADVSPRDEALCGGGAFCCCFRWRLLDCEDEDELLDGAPLEGRRLLLLRLLLLFVDLLVLVELMEVDLLGGAFRCVLLLLLLLRNDAVLRRLTTAADRCDDDTEEWSSSLLLEDCGRIILRSREGC